MTRQHTRLLLWLLALAVAACFVRLGAWQLQRMHEKQALLAQLPPGPQAAVTLQQALADPAALHWVRQPMRFLPGTIVLDNQLREGRAGVKLYQAARAVHGPATAVLVDLGWLPLPGNRQLPPIRPLQGELDVQGLWAPPPSAGIALGPALVATPQPQAWLATRLEMPAIAARLGLAGDGLASQVLRLDPALPFGHVRDLELLPNTLPPSRHLGYAVQWFALALAVLVIAATLQWRAWRRGGR